MKNPERYERQIMLKEIGKKGQKKLAEAKILVCGAGGLGSPAIIYLAAAGTGTIGICDFDDINISNLNRQILYGKNDAGKKKTQKAKNFIKKFNPETKINIFNKKLSRSNIDRILNGYDAVLDATDNFDTRFLINSAAYKNGIALISGAVREFEGIVMTTVPEEKTACFNCVYPFKPAAEKASGITGAVCGVIGSLQALEAVKYVLNLETLKNKLLIYSALENSFRIKNLIKRIECPVCGNNFSSSAP